MIMEKITSLSRWIKLLILFLALLQLSSFVGTMMLGKYVGNEYVLRIDWWGLFYSILIVDFNGSWSLLASSLHAAGFHPGLILGTVKILPYIFIYYFLYRLFSLYQQRQVFTARNFKCLINKAVVFIAWIVISLFYPILVAFILHVAGLGYEVSYILILGDQELKYALFGMIFYCIAWVMRHATELEEEAELTI
ncbi:DUF2975 domain-containing protein [Colwellia sp. MB3u-28]|nr:DUF2975 domain-containing protein [Colwellia sp. MB3u-28]MBA6259645.1 DUF2975 domain-containing protein [Colwellia sp. MB3u-41]